MTLGNAQHREKFMYSDLEDEPVFGTVSIGIPASIYHEFLFRADRNVNVAEKIKEIVYDWLDKSKGDAKLWSKRYIDEVSGDWELKLREEYGRENEGYQWKDIILYNHSKVRMKYKGKYYEAEIRHQKFMDGDEEISPARWTKKVADNTVRNAWRDIEIQSHENAPWVKANDYKKDFDDQLKIGEFPWEKDGQK